MSTQEKAKPTPGPWYVGTQNDGLFILNQPPRPSNDDINPVGPKGLIIIGAVYREVPFAEQQGNARLFAAAWEMLNALKAVKSLFASTSPFYIQKLDAPITNGDQERIDRVFIALDAAIAKAEADTGAAK